MLKVTPFLGSMEETDKRQKEEWDWWELYEIYPKREQQNENDFTPVRSVQNSNKVRIRQRWKVTYFGSVEETGKGDWDWWVLIMTRCHP